MFGLCMLLKHKALSDEECKESLDFRKFWIRSWWVVMVVAELVEFSWRSCMRPGVLSLQCSGRRVWLTRLEALRDTEGKQKTTLPNCFNLQAEVIMNYHVGETVLSLQKTTLIPGGSESLVYTTLSGGIGILVPFTSHEVESPHCPYLVFPQIVSWCWICLYLQLRVFYKLYKVTVKIPRKQNLGFF